MTFYHIDTDGVVVGSSDIEMVLPSGWTLKESDESVPFSSLELNTEGSLSTKSIPEPIAPPKPLEGQLASNVLAIAVYDYLKKKDVVLADVIALLFALHSNDYYEYQIRLSEINKRFT